MRKSWTDLLLSAATLLVVLPFSNSADADIIQIDTDWAVSDQNGYDLDEEYFATENLKVSFVIDTDIGIERSKPEFESQLIDPGFILSFSLTLELDGLSAFSSEPSLLNAWYTQNAGCGVPNDTATDYCGLLISGNLQSSSGNGSVEIWMLLEQLFGNNNEGGLHPYPTGWGIEDLFMIDHTQFHITWDEPENGIAFSRQYIGGNDYVAYDLTEHSVPEPKMYLLLGFGLLMLAIMRVVSQYYDTRSTFKLAKHSRFGTALTPH